MLTIFNPAGLENAIMALQNMTPEQLHDAAFFAATMAQHDIIDLTVAPVPQLLKFYDNLVAGDADALLGLFADEPKVNAPLSGEIRGEAAFRQFVAKEQKWLTEYSAEPNFFNIVITPERIVLELVIDVTRDGEKLDLPVAIAFDRNGDKITAVRIYHSTWLLTGGHSVRSPILELPALKLPEPAVVQAYMAAIEEPNQDFVLSLFTDDGYVREPSGSRYKHAGADARQNFYKMVLGAGGVILHHCTATYDGSSFAVEYICDQWGKTKLPPQAGLAIYDMDSPTKIAAVRIYDDIQPPFEG
jgi:ketosteroid isomerase-like protein